ncbi:DUF473 domain-containing protein [archaeon]|nr:MAG: DUF473 domain-containing protein [archaeon]
MYALTCITPRAYKELLTQGIKTFELRSAHNINSLTQVDVGEAVFITCKTGEDMTRETEGIIAIVKSASVHNTRQAMDFDEYEITTARVQLALVNTAKVKDVVRPETGKGVSVELEKVTYYRIS